MNFFDIISHEVVISNKEEIKPAATIAMKKWTFQYGWGGGHVTESVNQNCNAKLGVRDDV